MLNVSDGLRHSYLLGLNQVSYNLTSGLNTWLHSAKDYFPVGDNTTNRFTIGTYDYDSFLLPYAFDINRLSCAAIESINNITKDDISPKFLGWIIVKYYYSAFFSVHCILKTCNESISNIESNSLDSIRRLTKDYGFKYEKLNKGLYCLMIDKKTNNFTFYKDKMYDDSHEGTWLKFLHFLKGSIPGVYKHLALTDAQLIVEKLESLIEAITNWGSHNGNWLSRIRNSVNYSQSFGVWYPYRNFETDLDIVSSYQSLCKENALDIEIDSFRNKDLLYFVRTCQLINSINFDLLKDLRDRHPENKSFVVNGIVKYHHLFLKKSEYNTGLI